MILNFWCRKLSKIHYHKSGQAPKVVLESVKMYRPKRTVPESFIIIFDCRSTCYFLYAGHSCVKRNTIPKMTAVLVLSQNLNCV